MDSITKLIAMYLPQYHETEVNSKFWGKGYTDWVAVRNAQVLFEGHKQPKKPLNDNYYDLSQYESIKWQSSIIKKYGIYGLGIYHYWFNDECNLLEKPARIILDNKDIDVNFLFAWDNISWKRSWDKIKGNDWAPLRDTKTEGISEGILVKYELGNKSNWEKHFNHVLKYLKDDRYIKKDGLPVFLIYHTSDKVLEMEKYWNELARRNGLNGIYFINRYDKFKRYDRTQNYFYYEPGNSGWGDFSDRLLNKVRLYVGGSGLRRYNYDKIWGKIIKNAYSSSSNIYSGAFVAYDDTPRRGNASGKIVMGANPEKFEKYLLKLKQISEERRKEFIFITAWNEWGEGAYLEPDTNDGYKYLEAIYNVIHLEGVKA